MTDVEVVEERPPDWLAYSAVSIAFDSWTVLDVVDFDAGSIRLRERRLDVPFSKDYDAIAGEAPTRWARRFDVSRWGVLVARVAGKRVGGAVVAVDTRGVDMLEGRSDLTVLWDLRVAPGWRGRGVGSALFGATEHWARRRGKHEIKIETQNVNAAACHV